MDFDLNFEDTQNNNKQLDRCVAFAVSGALRDLGTMAIVYKMLFLGKLETSFSLCALEVSTPSQGGFRNT